MNINSIDNGSVNYNTSLSIKENNSNQFGLGTATKETDSSDDGKRIGIFTVGSKGYIVTYADTSTEDKPIVKIGKYEVSVNDVDPANATQLEMCALLSHLDATGQTGNQGISSFGKLRAYADVAEMNGFCEDINDPEAIYTKKQNWISIMSSIKNLFLENKATYHQALHCEKLIFHMTNAGNRRHASLADIGR